MARYVMASRRAGRFLTQEKEAAREAVGVALGSMPGIDIVADNDPGDPTARRVVVFDSEPGEVAAIAAGLPAEVMIEPEILHWPESHRPAEYVRADRSTLWGPLGAGQRLRLTITGDGAPLASAQVHLFLRGFGGLGRQAEETTGAAGEVEFSFSAFWEPAAVVAVPAGDHWSVVARGPRDGDVVDCPPLPADGPLAWWHQVLGVAELAEQAGGGVRVGVIDTGVGPHPALGHVLDVGAFIDGQFDPGGGADVDSHGSHVNGIIAARPDAAGAYWGIAPGVELASARVFPPGAGANQGDIANAIDFLSMAHQADLVNLSLGSPTPSAIEQDAIRDALERGTLCVCAAANSAGPVEFPAAFPETVAVSALGLLGWGPAGTLAATRLPQDPAMFGSENLYLANFSCFGPEVTCGAPGVGIISTVPARDGLAAPYASMGGTSMASPAVVGLLARLLAADEDYHQLPRDQTRAETARSVLVRACVDIDLHQHFQGAGIPRER